LGDLDLNVRDRLRSALLPLVEAPVAVIDLTDVGFADTTLLYAVIRLVNERHSSGQLSHLCIVGAKSRIKRIFEITGINKLVCFKDSIEETSLEKRRRLPSHQRLTSLNSVERPWLRLQRSVSFQYTQPYALTIGCGGA
jgi:anti-anti-sigma factor